MTDPISTIKLDAVEPGECQHRTCSDDATRIFAIQGTHGKTPSVAGYCRYHQEHFASQKESHTLIGTPKRDSDISEVTLRND